MRSQFKKNQRSVIFVIRPGVSCETDLQQLSTLTQTGRLRAPGPDRSPAFPRNTLGVYIFAAVKRGVEDGGGGGVWGGAVYLVLVQWVSGKFPANQNLSHLHLYSELTPQSLPSVPVSVHLTLSIDSLILLSLQFSPFFTPAYTHTHLPLSGPHACRKHTHTQACKQTLTHIHTPTHPPLPLRHANTHTEYTQISSL